MDDLEAQVMAERARRGLTLSEMARQTGVSAMTLRRIEQTGKARRHWVRRRLQLWLEGRDPLEASARVADIEARLAALVGRPRVPRGGRARSD